MHNFRRIFLCNYWWHESDIWSQASYRYAILWEEFVDPSDSYFLFGDLVGFYKHLTWICICTFFVAFFSLTIDDRNLIFGHKLYIGTSYHGKRFWTIRFLLPKDWEGHVPCTIGASKSIVAHWGPLSMCPCAPCKFWLIILLFHVSIKVVFYFVSWFCHCLHSSLISL